MKSKNFFKSKRVTNLLAAVMIGVFSIGLIQIPTYATDIPKVNEIVDNKGVEDATTGVTTPEATPSNEADKTAPAEVTPSNEANKTAPAEATPSNEADITAPTEVTGSAITAPAEVTGSAITVQDAALKITWTDPQDANFKEVKIFGANNQLVNTVAKGTQSATIDKLINGTEYTFTIKTVDATGTMLSTGVQVKGTPKATVLADIKIQSIKYGSSDAVVRAKSECYATMVINNTSDDKVFCAEVTIDYDATAFSYTSCMEGSTSYSVNSIDSSTPGTVKIVVKSTEPIKGSDVNLVKVAFTAKATDADKTAKIDMKSCILKDATGNVLYSTEGISKTVQIIKYVPAGDVNGDNEVNAGDLAIAASNNGSKVNDNNWMSDVSSSINGVCDGTIDENDMDYIVQKMLESENK